MSNTADAKPCDKPAPKKRRPRKKLELPQDEEAMRQEQELKKQIAQSLHTQHSARSEVEALEEKKKYERIYSSNGGEHAARNNLNTYSGAHNCAFTGNGVVSGDFRSSSIDLTPNQMMINNAHVQSHQNSPRYMTDMASGGQQGWQEPHYYTGGGSLDGRDRGERNNGGITFYNSQIGQFSQQQQQQQQQQQPQQQQQQQQQLMLQQQRQDDFAKKISRDEIMLSLKQEANRIKSEALKLKAVLDQCKNLQREGISPVYTPTPPPHGSAGADGFHPQFSTASHSRSNEVIYQSDRSSNHQHSSRLSHSGGGMIRTSYKTPSPSPGNDGGSHQSSNYSQSHQNFNSNGVDGRVYQTQSPSNSGGIPKSRSPSIDDRNSHLNTSSSNLLMNEMLQYKSNTQLCPPYLFAEQDRNQYSRQFFDPLPVNDEMGMQHNNINGSNSGLREQQHQKSSDQYKKRQQSNYDFPIPYDKMVSPRTQMSHMLNSGGTPTVSNVTQVPNMSRAPPPPFHQQQGYQHQWNTGQNQHSYQNRQQQRSDEFQPQSIQPRQCNRGIADDDYRNSLTIQDISGGHLQQVVGHLSFSSGGGSFSTGQSGGSGDRNCSILSGSIGTFHASASLRSSMQSSIGSLEFRGGVNEQDTSKYNIARNVPQNVALGIVREESERDFTSLSRRESEIERPSELSGSVDRSSDRTLHQLCETTGEDSLLTGINGRANEVSDRTVKRVAHQVSNSESRSFVASLMEGELMDSNLFDDSKNLENMASLKSVDLMMSMDSMGFSRKSDMNMSLEDLDEGNESSQSSIARCDELNSADQKPPSQNSESKEKQSKLRSDPSRNNSYRNIHSSKKHANPEVMITEISNWSKSNPFQNCDSNLDKPVVAHPTQHLRNRVTNMRQSLGDFDDFEGLEDVASIHESADVNNSMMSSMTDNDLTSSLKAMGLEHSRSRV